MSLTEEGAALLPRVRRALEDLEAALDDVRAERGTGILRVSMLASFLQQWLLPRMPRFQAAHPAITLYVHTSIDMVDFVRSDHQVAIRLGRGPRWPGVDSEKLLEQWLVPVCTPALLREHGPVEPRGVQGLDLRRGRAVSSALPAEPSLTAAALCPARPRTSAASPAASVSRSKVVLPGQVGTQFLSRQVFQQADRHGDSGTLQYPDTGPVVARVRVENGDPEGPCDPRGVPRTSVPSVVPRRSLEQCCPPVSTGTISGRCPQALPMASRNAPARARSARARRAVTPPRAAAGRGDASLSVVVLAAGQGKRMRSALPKVLQPLAGQPLLAHVLELACSLEPAAIHVVYGHGGERVREHFTGTEAAATPAGSASARAALRWVLQAEQLGTGHALEQAMPAVPDEHLVLVLYGDVPLLCAATLRALVARAGDRSVALLTAMPADAEGYGRIVRDRGGRIRRIVEQRDASATERSIREINTGVLVAPARHLRRWLGALEANNAQREYYLTDVVGMAVRDGFAVQPLLAADALEVLGVNDRLQLAEAESEYRRRRARELMARGVTVIDPARLDVRGSVEVDTDVLLDVNVVLEGPVRLGAGVHIGPNCVVHNASIGARTVLHANCVVHDADVGADCRIGPFARLRPGARLGDAVHAGNFVEIKNSEIGAGSKVNHLSYVGDATVGSDVNVGAGTITCNYDGVDKWRTRIGDGAFIGSGSMLVAPVEIGAGATIGAGSTITADAPADKLTLARSRQLTIEEWQRRRKPRES